ncbi:hypothetical protein BpHYR1_050500 [Brachionus plicatilis]|uniref:Uncharacterized protein n=1 Tax=Brachionus plicatilis TaxID=10195 RepID=A0A3M7S8F3_BRAPC|nr:hypothetical protein BpHYR1_050500 [Brachionus plicatilis]
MENWWLRFLILYPLCLIKIATSEPLRIFPYHGDSVNSAKYIKIKTLSLDNDEFSSRFDDQFSLYSDEYRKKRDSEVYSITDPYSVSNRINCNYTISEKKLKCSGPSKTIECACDYKLEKSEKSFLYFGIEKFNFDQNLTNIMLYPRTLGQTSWLNSTIWSLNRFIKFSIHHEEDVFDFGLRVEKNCFENLLDFFESTKFYTSINLIENKALKFKSSNVKIIGSLVIVS